MTAPARSGAGLGDAKVLLPFLLVTLIWSSTWLVIKDQLGDGGPGSVPPPWSVCYRFAIAAAAMFAIAALGGTSLKIGRRGHLLALAMGIPQFFLNFNFVYAAEQYITSGLVAVVFALLVVPNAALAWIFFGQRVSARFMAGSALAGIGVALLFAAELRLAQVPQEAVAWGIAFTLLGILSASASNVLQISEGLRSRPLVPMLAWAMLYGSLAMALYASVRHGAPVVESRPGYWIGLIYLGVAASALAFTLYFRVIREIGPAKAAYSSVLVPVIAMALSTAFENYRWTLLAALGGVLAMAGLVIALSARRTAAAVAPVEPTA